MFGKVMPPERPMKEIRTPKEIIRKMLLGRWNKHSFSTQEVIAMTKDSKLSGLEGQTLYYPGKIQDLPLIVRIKDEEVVRLAMESHKRIQRVISDVLVELGCDLFCVTDPALERKDLLGTGYSLVYGREHLLLKEGNPKNPLPLYNKQFERSDFSAYERIVRYLGVDLKMKFLKIVENLAGCEYLNETTNYSLEQRMQVLADTMKKCHDDHIEGTVNRDIKQENCLVLDDPSRKLGVRGKLTDQELVEPKGDIPINPDTNERNLVGTPIYYDVSYYAYPLNEVTSLRPSIDVFAYGITLLSVYLMKQYNNFMDDFYNPPYEKCITKDDLLNFLNKCGVEIPDDVLDTIVGMLHKDRNLRPQLHTIIKFLKEKYDLE